MRKKIIFCAFLLFGQNFLLFGQQKIMFLTGKIPASKTPVSHLFLAGNFKHNDHFTIIKSNITLKFQWQLLKK